MRIIEAPIYVGLACLEIGAFHDEFGSGYEQLICIEISYKPSRINDDDASNLIFSYLFEIADSTGFIFYLSEIHKHDIELEQKIEKILSRDGVSLSSEEDETYALKPLLPFNESMKLYVSAMQTNDEELRLLNFYVLLLIWLTMLFNSKYISGFRRIFL